jgi:aspartate carbamoyltransferase catalytic subunit
MKEGKLRHLIRAQQLSRGLLDELFFLADRIRDTQQTPDGAMRLKRLHPHRRAGLYFTQPSTRTFISFESACQILGMDCVEIRDPSTSSEVKGESPIDSLATIGSYVDVIIMRSPQAGLAEEAARYFDGEWLSRSWHRAHIINGGSGQDQHPTQAILDAYTLYRAFRKRDGIEGKTIVMVGDLKRGRTVRSLAYLMKHFPGVRLIFVSPPTFGMKEDIKGFLREHKISFEETEDFDAAVRVADAVYMTRIQDEHDTERGESAAVDISRYCFEERHLTILGPNAVVMHPLPRRQELNPACDRDPRVVIWRQEWNGMWARAALLHLILREPDPLDPSRTQGF